MLSLSTSTEKGFGFFVVVFEVQSHVPFVLPSIMNHESDVDHSIDRRTEIVVFRAFAEMTQLNDQQVARRSNLY